MKQTGLGFERSYAVHTLVLTLKCLKCSYVLTPLSGTVCTALSWTCLDCLDMSGYVWICLDMSGYVWIYSTIPSFRSSPARAQAVAMTDAACVICLGQSGKPLSGKRCTASRCKLEYTARLKAAKLGSSSDTASSPSASTPGTAGQHLELSGAPAPVQASAT